MAKFGFYLAVFGLLSMVLSFFNLNFKILAWIDLWGTAAGWGIRIGFVVVGILIAFLAFRNEALTQKRKREQGNV